MRHTFCCNYQGPVRHAPLGLVCAGLCHAPACTLNSAPLQERACSHPSRADAATLYPPALMSSTSEDRAARTHASVVASGPSSPSGTLGPVPLPASGPSPAAACAGAAPWAAARAAMRAFARAPWGAAAVGHGEGWEGATGVGRGYSRSGLVVTWQQARPARGDSSLLAALGIAWARNRTDGLSQQKESHCRPAGPQHQRQHKQSRPAPTAAHPAQMGPPPPCGWCCPRPQTHSPAGGPRGRGLRARMHADVVSWHHTLLHRPHRPHRLRTVCTCAGKQVQLAGRLA